MDSLVSHQHQQQTQYPHNQFSMQVDAHHLPFPSSFSSSASSSSSLSGFSTAGSSASSRSSMPASAPKHHAGAAFPPAFDHRQSHQQLHQHSSPALQIQTATPAPHEQEPEEQTAHPSRASSGQHPTSFSAHDDHSVVVRAISNGLRCVHLPRTGGPITRGMHIPPLSRALFLSLSGGGSTR
ncbi:hypothetical protein BN946_scf184788.g6 [Trametes cinnabarina]|uniref:Uncharacterized protein n=1 Tax=Pycnoporus cinnabarinus TaxID=5643 RepID=A0A060S1B6_PYCCI|nr:hypothetical protein BN946_scf184788.g6 [Trametes cinnabarina]